MSTSQDDVRSFVAEKLPQMAAVLITLILTARTLDVWLCVDAAGRPTYTRALVSPGSKLCNLLGRLAPPLGEGLAKLGHALLATAFAGRDALAEAYTHSLNAASPMGWLARCDQRAGQVASTAILQLRLWFRAALPMLLRAKALFIREEGVWF